MLAKRLIICGAAGRDFHTFNVLYRDNPDYEVVAFTATQIPDIQGRVYPSGLAGAAYPQGIPVHGEEKLGKLITRLGVQEVVFAYSDVPHEQVMHLASIAQAAGAAFVLPSPSETMISSGKPVVSICAVRTGCGKSPTTRAVADILTNQGLQVVAIRHPMPYGNLADQKVQRFAAYDDLDKQHCTIEEREEYEPHIDRGRVVYAGVDYAAILARAEAEADIILWDGGNNDTPFIRPDLEIVLVDPLRPGHELRYHPGEINFRRADVIVINKIDSAEPEAVALIEENIARFNPSARVIKARSRLIIDQAELINGKKVLVIEDGPTVTHGEMKFGAGIVAAERNGAAQTVDPRPWVTGTIADTFNKYPGIGPLLPAMGYGRKQIKDLEDTINRIDCDLVISATPIDLTRIIKINKKMIRVSYELEEVSHPGLSEILSRRFRKERD